jgi:hypothetical protein
LARPGKVDPLPADAGPEVKPAPPPTVRLPPVQILPALPVSKQPEAGTDWEKPKPAKPTRIEPPPPVSVMPGLPAPDR